MISRRQFIGIVLASLVSPLALADAPVPGLPASASGAVVVELINFHCPRCRAVNDHFESLSRHADAAGLKLRIAPVTWDGQSAWPDRMYYAVRDLCPAAEALMRDTLFDGIQREGLQFESLAQVVSYLERRQFGAQAAKLDSSFNLVAIADRAASDVSMLSEMKAGRLLMLAETTEVPTFAWVREGQVVGTVAPVDGQEPVELIQRVVRKMAGQNGNTDGDKK